MIGMGVEKYKLEGDIDYVGEAMGVYFDVNNINVVDPLKFLWKEVCDLETEEVEYFENFYSEALKIFEAKTIERVEMFAKIDGVLDGFRNELTNEYYDCSYISADIDGLYSVIFDIDAADDNTIYTLLEDSYSDLTIYFESKSYQGLFHWSHSA